MLSVEGPPLLDGWKELIDEASGPSYYFNNTTDKRTWERPTVAAVAAATAVAAAAAVAAAVAAVHLDGGNVDATTKLEVPV